MFKSTWAVARTTVQNFFAESCFLRASALSFSTLLGLVPLMFVSVVVLSAFPTFQSLGKEVQDFIFSNFIPTTGHTVQQYLQNFVEQTSHLSQLSIIGTIVSALLMMTSIQEAFNAIWHQKLKPRGLMGFLRFGLALTLIPIFIGVSLVVITYLGSLSWFGYTAMHAGLTKVLLVVTPFLLAVITFTTLYIVLPRGKVAFRHGFSSGIFAALLFEACKYGFTLYLQVYPAYQLIYGAFATIPIFLFWIYLSWVIILLGAVMCNALATR